MILVYKFQHLPLGGCLGGTLVAYSQQEFKDEGYSETQQFVTIWKDTGYDYCTQMHCCLQYNKLYTDLSHIMRSHCMTMLSSLVMEPVQEQMSCVECKFDALGYMELLATSFQNWSAIMDE